jgi:hypothetical protein
MRLIKNKIDHTVGEKIIIILENILNQNYKYEGKFYKPNKGIAMGSPISGILQKFYTKYRTRNYETHHGKQKHSLLYKIRR